ncbi:MAG: hypothetical protein JNG88_15230 [Phycisphaerales bacterium]|nr:hypothetical protein [Phycisphaerales bacterium]
MRSHRKPQTSFMSDSPLLRVIMLVLSMPSGAAIWYSLGGRPEGDNLGDSPG